MSMLNRRLQTQPLDPAVLQALEQRQPQLPPLPSSRETAPLKSIEGLLGDRFAPPASLPPSGVPAQLPDVSSALKPLPPAAAPVSASADPLNTPLSASESELLLDVSARLAGMRQQSPAQFQQVLQGLQKLNAGSDGQVDFSALSAPQQQALSGLGLNPQNTKVIFQQLYHMLLPNAQPGSSDGFKQVQASVTSFISNLDLRSRTFSQISEQARDLTAVQGVVSHLSAGSIQSLLADQTGSVYDLSVSRINKSNFDIRSGMDYTLGHFVVLSQQSPATLQQVEGAIQKIKQDGTLNAEERTMLNRYGLDLNAENKLQTLDGNVLDFQAVNKLENVLFSMKDPTEGYQRVLAASASVIQQSGKLEALAARAQSESQVVQTTTAVVQAQTQNLQEIQAAANQIDTRIQFAKTKADHLTTAMDAATGLFGQLQLNPSLLSRWNIRTVPQANGTTQFFIDDKQVSRLELLHHLGKLLETQQAEINQMAAELAQKKTAALQTIADISENNTTLAVQTDKLEETKEEIKQETQVLQGLVAERDKVVAEVMPTLKPEEQQRVLEDLTPAVDQHVAQAQTQAQEAVKLIEQVVVQARAVHAEAEQVVAAVQADLPKWEQTLEVAAATVKQLGWAIEALEAEGKSIARSDAPPPLVRAEAEVSEGGGGKDPLGSST